jgi:3-oxoacyl-[acyl-carrier-protein] synthase III
MKDVYLNRISKFLPNEPVTNDEIESRLGLINGNESINRGLILRSNQIKTRYYALDEKGNPTHTNAELTAIAIRKLFDEKIKLEDIELLAAGTSSADVIQPSHATMVQGELGSHPMEVMSAAGTCNAGMLSLKYAMMAIKSGQVKNAVCSGSETLGAWMHAKNFSIEIDRRKEIEDNPYIAFEKDFLRWMLSDGAAAILIQDKPNENKLSLRVDWIELKSFANELETCMYAGCKKIETGNVIGWKAMTPEERDLNSVFSLKQDARLLQEYVVPYGSKYFRDLMNKHQFTVKDFDYFLPHISSMFFKKKIYEGLLKEGINIPYEKWFLNLTKVGNIGAASAFVMLEEIFNSGALNKGDRLLVMVPESARFSFAFMFLTVV